MLKNNKMYDSQNLRGMQKLFNDGVVDFYTAEGRVLKEEKARFYFSRESVSFESYTQGSQDSKTSIYAIGIPAQGALIEHGDIALINDEYYFVDHAQYKDDKHPAYYKVYLEKSTVPFVKNEEDAWGDDDEEV